MKGKCDEMKMLGPLEQIKASYNKGKGVNSITYYRDSQKKTYGSDKNIEDTTTWKVT